MEQSETNSQFNAELLCPAKPGEGAPWAFIVLPREASEKLPRRGRTTVEASLNGHHFQVTLEPDGQLSHWPKESKENHDAAGVSVGGAVDLGLTLINF